KAWRDVAQAYEDFAEDPANQELDVDDVLKMAAADATRINYRLDKLKASAHDYRAQLKAQLSEIENTTKTLLTAADNHVKARKYSRAIQAVEAGATGKPKSKDPLRAFLGWEWVSPVDASTRRKAVEIEAITEKLKGSREALKNKRDEAAAKAGEDSKRVHEQVDQLTAGEDDAQWDRAIAELRTVEELFGEAEGDAKPPRIWPLVRDARSRRTKLQITLNEDRERSLKADRQAIFDVVRKHSTLSPVAQFNYVQDLRLQRALEVYRGVHGELSSERYRAWVQERIGLLLWTEWLLKRLRADIEQSSSRSKQPALVSLDLELPRPGQKPRLGRLVRFDKKHKPASAGEINFKPRRNREEVRHLGEFPMDWVYDNVFHHEGKPRWARLTPDLQFALGAVAFEIFQYRAARDHFQALAKDATYGEVATKLAERARLEDRAFTEYERLCKMVESEPDSTKLKALEAELGTFGRRHPGVAFLLQVLSPQNARNTEFVGSDPVTVPLPPPPPAPPTSPQ
ncbi:MAG: hypothetical protein O7C98_15570, partial [Planctomycetota bacterium]|nr:hypothetical protein [Planctomycetota bacterium]